MKFLISILLCLIVFNGLNASDWNKIELPTAEYFKLANNLDKDYTYFTSADSLPYSQTPFSKYSSLKAAFIKAGADSSMFGQIVVLESSTIDILALSRDRVALYSNNRGKTWDVSTMPLEGNMLHYESVLEKFGYKIYFLDHRGAPLLISEDRCRTWAFYNDDPIYHMQKVNDSTLFYVGQELNSDSYSVYKNMYTNHSDSVRFIKDWDYQTTNVIGDTIMYFSSTHGAFRSTDRGHNWSEWLDLDEIFTSCYDSSGEEGISVRTEGNNILLGKRCYPSTNSSTLHYIISPDLGKTWFFRGEEYLEINFERYKYFTPGTYTKYVVETDELSKVNLNYSKYGNFRTKDGIEYYQSQDGYKCDYRTSPDESWVNLELENKPRYITKSGKVYFCDDSSHLNRLINQDTLRLVSYCSSFQVLHESPEIDMIRINKSQPIVYTFIGNKYYYEFNTFYDSTLIACIDEVNPNYACGISEDIYKSEIPLVIGEVQSDSKDSILLDMDVKIEDMYQVLLNGNTIYLICKDSVYISDDRGESFRGIENPQNYKIHDDLYNNAKLLDGVLYTVGSKGLLFLSKDDSWKSLDSDLTKAYMFALEFFDDIIYVYTEEDLYYTDINTSIEDRKKVSNQKIGISPNPASDYLQFSFDSNIESISVIGLNGNVFDTESNGNQIDISDLSSGTYFLKIKSGDKIYLKQFVVAK